MAEGQVELSEGLTEILCRLRGQVEQIGTQLQPTAEDFQLHREEILELEYGPDLYAALRQASRLAEEIPLLIENLTARRSVITGIPVVFPVKHGKYGELRLLSDVEQA